MPDVRRDAVSTVSQALRVRTGIGKARADALTKAYIDASIDRAVAVAVAGELPPTAMKQAQISLLMRVLANFGDLPSREEVAALLRITPTVARSLLNEVLAASDTASEVLLRSVFSRATKGDKTGPGGEIPNGHEWSFASPADMDFAKSRLEFIGTRFRTRKSTDGEYVLLIDPLFDPHSNG